MTTQLVICKKCNNFLKAEYTTAGADKDFLLPHKEIEPTQCPICKKENK